MTPNPIPPQSAPVSKSSPRVNISFSRDFHYALKLEAVKRRITLEALVQEMYALYRHKHPQKPL